MSRGSAAANVTAASEPVARPIGFVELQVDTGTLRLHDSIGTLTWGGQTWTGIGALGSIGEVEETDQPSPYRVQLTMNALEPTILSALQDEELFERVAIFYRGFFDAQGYLAGTPDERWRGYTDSADVVYGGDMDSVTLNCESEVVRDFTASGSLFTEEDQQTLFAGDTGFEYLDQIVDAAGKVHWGPEGSPVFFGERPVTIPPRGPRGRSLR